MHCMSQMKTILALLAVFVAADAVKLKFRPIAVDPASVGTSSSPAWCKNLDCPSFKVLQKTEVRIKCYVQLDQKGWQLL